MLRKPSVLILISLALFSVVFPTGLVPRAHAAGKGLVCIAQVTDTMCGASPTFNGPLTSPNSLLRVPVMINNTDPFLGFDIFVNSSDPSILRPFGADLAGSMMPPGSIVLSECIGGFNVVGSACSSFAGPSVVRLAVVGPFGFLSSPGATGLLFTAIFQIAGTTAPGGITISFQSGCTATSTPGKCVVITNGTISPVPESIQSGGFDNSDTTMLPYTTLSTSTSSLGASFTGAPTFIPPPVTFTATSQNGFNTSSTAGLSLAVGFNGTGARPTASLSPTAIDLTGIATQTFTQNSAVPSTVKPGLYIATVTATYTSQDLLTFTTSSLAAAYSLPLQIVDYSISASPNPVTVPSGTSQLVTVQITSRTVFSNPVKLGVSIPPATLTAGITAHFSSNTLVNGVGSAILNVTSSPATPHGPFSLTIASNSTLNGFTKVHNVNLLINPVGPDFGITANPSSIVLSSPFNSTFAQSSTITLTSLNFTGAVHLSTLVTPQDLPVALGASVLTLKQNGQNTTSLTPILSASIPPGTYKVTVIGTAGLISHNANVTVTILLPPPSDFSLSANPNLLSLSAASSSSVQSTITATSMNGFSGNLTLSATSDVGFSGSFNFVFAPPRIVLGSGSSASSTLFVTAVNVSPGTYHVTVVANHLNPNGTSAPASHSVVITVQVVPAPRDFQIDAPQGVITILAGTPTSVGIYVFSIGPSQFIGTVTLSGQISPLVQNGPSFSFNPVQVTPGQFSDFSDLTITTTALTPPGNYTLTIQGTSGTLVHSANVHLTVLPSPTLTTSPSSGPIGTLVTIHGTGFVFPSQGPFSSPVELEMTFDDQLVGFVFLQNSSFNFAFDVPVSQVGSHQIHVKSFFPGLDIQTSFVVTSASGALNVSVSTGTMYFQSDTVTIFVSTTLNGQAISVSNLHFLLVKPNGSSASLNFIQISTGYYKAAYLVPSSGAFGTYSVEVTAKRADGSTQLALTTFEVKPTWLQSNGHNIATATTLAGAVGALGLVGLAWRKGFFTRRKDELPGF